MKRKIRKKQNKKIILWRYFFIVLSAVTCCILLFLAVSKIGTGIMVLSEKIGIKLQSVEISESGYAPIGKRAKDCIGKLPVTSMFKISIDEIYSKLTKNPWILNATVHKAFPDKISIAVVYKKPIAAFFDGKEYTLIDEMCSDIEKIDKNNVKQDMPVICGYGAKEHFVTLLKMLSDFHHIIKAADSFVFVSKRRWNIVLRNKTIVKLPANNIKTALTTLDTMIQQKIAYGTSIDLRTDQVIVSGVKINSHNSST